MNASMLHPLCLRLVLLVVWIALVAMAMTLTPHSNSTTHPAYAVATIGSTSP